MLEYKCTKEDHLKRIDHILQHILPDFGLRSRRRFCEQGFVSLNGKKVKPATKVCENDLISFDSSLLSSDFDKNLAKDQIQIIYQTKDFVAIYKPSQVHSAKINAKINQNMEDLVLNFFPNTQTHLLNRLDFSTSGILMFALHQEAKELWENFQKKHLTIKTYFAIVEGHLKEKILINNKLNLAKTSTRVSDEIGEHCTKTSPLLHFFDKNKNPLSLLSCTITKGARHQIRAHLSSIGHVIINDKKYGATLTYSQAEIDSLSFIDEIISFDFNSAKTFTSTEKTSLEYVKNKTKTINPIFSENFFLHHTKIEFPNFQATYFPQNFKHLPQTIQDHLKNSI